MDLWQFPDRLRAAQVRQTSLLRSAAPCRRF